MKSDSIIKDYFSGEINIMEKMNNTFYKTFMQIGIPIALQHLISSSLNLVDTFMIGRLGETAIASVGVANRVFFLFIISIFGIYSGFGIFTAQYWGKKDTVNIHKVLGAMLLFGVGLSAIFMSASLIFPEKIMGIFTKDFEVVQNGIGYMRIVALSYTVTAISFAYSFSSRAVHRTTLPMIVSAVALSTNTILNFILINGYLGFPALGVKGAAIATLISRMLEFLILIINIYKDKTHPLAAKFRDMIDINFNMIKNLVKTGMPVFLNEAIWVFGTTIYFIAFGMLGTEALAVIQIAYSVSDFFQSLSMGIGNAAGVMIGNSIGNCEFEKAYDYGGKFLKLTFIFSIILAGILFLSRPLILMLYKSFALETQVMLFKSLAVIAVFQIPKMFTFTMIVGVLRGGGDTKFCLILDALSVWFIGIPLGFISVMVFNLPVHLVLASVFLEEVFKMFITVPRFIKKKWINNVIEFSYNKV